MTDDELRTILRGLGIGQEQRSAVALLPMVQVAWADGLIQDGEREAIEAIAADLQLVDADTRRLLEGWLRYRPSHGYFERGRIALQGLWAREVARAPARTDLLGFSEGVARAAGGLFGSLFTVAPEEKVLLADLAGALSLDLTKNVGDYFDEDHEDFDDDGPEVTDGVGFDPESFEDLPTETSEAPPEHTGPRLVVARTRIPDVHLQDHGIDVGRRRDNHVCLPGDSAVSRQHCRVIPDGDRWYVVDCGSLHGTWVGGERVSERRLFGGERIRIGGYTLRYRP